MSDTYLIFACIMKKMLFPYLSIYEINAFSGRDLMHHEFDTMRIYPEPIFSI